ncbi:MAG: YigZ family protein [Clostridia bacterium]|nr:YigZ family protein [Clostridia bacterium]
MKVNELIINKSRFIGIMQELTCEEDIAKTLNAIKLEHKKATHICYAYVYSVDKVLEKCSDDGEPKGTAGAPIMNVIKKRGVKNTLIIVVRYFGGIKLGSGGLVRAYSKIAGSLFN